MGLQITKVKAVAEDIEFGVGTVEQVRNGVSGTYSQINASHIPYSPTQSISEKVESLESGTNLALKYAWEAEARKRTAASYAKEAENVEVKEYTSNNDGSFSVTSLTGTYSALHYEAKADGNLDAQNWKADASKMTAESYAVESTDVIVYTSNGDGTFTQTVQTGVDSAKTARDKASVSAAAAATSESNAATSESNAATSESNALASKNAAATSESNAATSESNAATSESNAKTSETNAYTKATEAATSASNAATSESNAATSANNAATSESNASTSAANAAVSEANAAQSASDAQTTLLSAVKHTNTNYTGSIILSVGTTAQRDTTPSDGYFRYNSELNQFEGYRLGNWGSVGGGATGGGTDDVFYENSQVVTQDYTLTSGKNAITAGPVTINDGITVTVPDGSNWVIV